MRNSAALAGKQFSIIGAAGYIARRHVASISRLGGEVVSVCDTHDNVGYIEGYFPKAEFYRTSFEWKKNLSNSVYAVVCTPNDYHYEHVCDALDMGARVVCEKPLVMRTREIDTLLNEPVYPVLQLRFSKAAELVKESQSKSIYMRYIAPRGKWYEKSWKGDFDKSGGILWNIGIHPFDLLCNAFGTPTESTVNFDGHRRAEGFISFDDRRVAWTLGTEGSPCRMMWGSDFAADMGRDISRLHDEFYVALAENSAELPTAGSAYTVTKMIEGMTDDC